MNIMKLFLLLTLFVSTPILALDEQEFIDSYLKGNILELEEHLDEQVYFRDSAMNLQGKKDYVETLSNVFLAIPRTEFKQERIIRSGNDILVVGELDFDYRGQALGVPGKVFTFKLAFSIALTIKNDKVISHIDFVDTVAFQKQMRAQMAS